MTSIFISAMSPLLWLLLFAVLAVFALIYRRLRAKVLDEAGQAAAAAKQSYALRQSELEGERNKGLISEAEFQALLVDVQRQLLDEYGDLASPALSGERRQRFAPILLLVLAAVLAWLSVGLYQQHGANKDLQFMQLQEAYQVAPNADTWAAMASWVEQAASDEGGRWQNMAAQMAMNDGDYRRAAGYYASLAKQFPEDAGIIAQWGQALFMANGNVLLPEIRDLLLHALSLDPEQTTALGALGVDAFSRQDYLETLRYWQPLYRKLSPGTPRAAWIFEGLNRAKIAAIETGELPGVIVDIALPKLETVAAEQLLSWANEGLSLFIAVRQQQGAGPPLAALRVGPSDLARARAQLSEAGRLRFALVDADSPMVNGGFSHMPALRVSAQLSVAAGQAPRYRSSVDSDNWQDQPGLLLQF